MTSCARSAKPIVPLEVMLEGRRVRLSDADLLGVGGEARVYRGPRGLALKVFHEPDPIRFEKVRRLAARAPALPRELVCPLAVLSDRAGAPVGYAMPRVDEATPFARLAQRGFRERVVSNGDVVALFRELHAVVADLHGGDVVIGDFNDENVLFSGLRPWLIDADSMQLDGLPCLVGHERFLDPALYGVDLSRAPAFGPGTDWFAFATMLFSSLLYVHPYGGVHRRLPTMLRRAEARHSVLRADVTWPRAASTHRALPDDLLHWFTGVFDEDHRGAPPVSLLAPEAWRRCAACGLEHARAGCPRCTSGFAPTRTLVRVHGRCTARTLFATRGRLVAAAVDGARARWAYEEDGVVRREDGSRVIEQKLLPDMAFVIAGASTWIGHRGRLVRVEGERAVERASTGTFRGATVFAVSENAIFRTDGGDLVDGSRGTRVGRVLDGQTFLWAGRGLGFGLWRAGLVTWFFLFHGDRPGLARVLLPPVDGRLVDAHVVFDDAHALVLLATEKGGARTHAMHLVASDGAVIASAVGRPDDARSLAHLRGKALHRGQVLAATDEGLVRLEASSGRLIERAHFPDTAPFLGAGVDLLPGPDGAVHVVTTQEIVRLEA